MSDKLVSQVVAHESIEDLYNEKLWQKSFSGLKA